MGYPRMKSRLARIDVATPGAASTIVAAAAVGLEVVLAAQRIVIDPR